MEGESWIKEIYKKSKNELESNKIRAQRNRKKIEDEFVVVNNGNVDILNFNVSILNSVGANIVNRAQSYFEMIERDFCYD